MEQSNEAQAARSVDRALRDDISALAERERELQRQAPVADRMAQQMGVPVDETEFSEIERNVAPTDVLHVLDEHRRQEGLE